MKALIIVLVTLTFSILAQASMPDHNIGEIHETSALEASLNPGILY